VVKPDDPAQLCSANAASLLWSDDAGVTWRSLPTPATKAVRVLAATAGAPGHLYLASGEDRFWRTDMQGGAFIEITALGGSVESVASALLRPDDVYAIVRIGDRFTGSTKLMRSSDAGMTWEQVGKGALKGWIERVTVAPGDPDTVDVLAEAGALVSTAVAQYYRSRDRGQTWSKPITVGGFAGPMSIDAKDPNRIVTFSDFNTPRISTDGGRTWQSIANPQANITEPTAVAALGDGIVLGALAAEGPHDLCRLVGSKARPAPKP
jgi:hypothetical protein